MSLGLVTSNPTSSRSKRTAAPLLGDIDDKSPALKRPKIFVPRPFPLLETLSTSAPPRYPLRNKSRASKSLPTASGSSAPSDSRKIGSDARELAAVQNECSTLRQRISRLEVHHTQILAPAVEEYEVSRAENETSRLVLEDECRALRAALAGQNILRNYEQGALQAEVAALREELRDAGTSRAAIRQSHHAATRFGGRGWGRLRGYCFVGLRRGRAARRGCLTENCGGEGAVSVSAVRLPTHRPPTRRGRLSGRNGRKSTALRNSAQNLESQAARYVLLAATAGEPSPAMAEGVPVSRSNMLIFRGSRRGGCCGRLSATETLSLRSPDKDDGIGPITRRTRHD
ncbi:hypothetical protein DFH09DRAFT_1424903 [Mycena vulgaris]|nr:hypothetical protein DFH09DRAFT_1373597 [Mycena vulgaris]KAJ6521580.1 hypothetical protein DFH09DRAFT_1424903 [Mycena vulgaris]